MSEQEKKKRHDINNQLQLLYHHIGVIGEKGRPEVKKIAEKALKAAKKIGEANSSNKLDPDFEAEFDRLLEKQGM